MPQSFMPYVSAGYHTIGQKYNWATRQLGKSTIGQIDNWANQQKPAKSGDNWANQQRSAIETKIESTTGQINQNKK